MKENMHKQLDVIIHEKTAGRGLTAKKTNEYKKRIEQEEPIDYIIGWKPFLNLKIDLSRRPLIPRVETEYWTNEAIAYIKENYRSKKTLKILDIFCGSGCIGLAAVKNIPAARADFADWQRELRFQVKKNAALNNLGDTRVRFIHSDIFSKISGLYDVIFANPPYVPASAKNKLPKSVIAHEPAQALFGGSDGLKYIKRFLADLPGHLEDGGVCFLEYNTPQKKKIEKIIKQCHFRGEFLKDQYGRFRYVRLFKKSA